VRDMATGARSPSWSPRGSLNADEMVSRASPSIIYLQPAHRILSSSPISSVDVCGNVVTTATLDCRIHQWNINLDKVLEVRGGGEGWNGQSPARETFSDPRSGDMLIQFRSGEVFYISTVPEMHEDKPMESSGSARTVRQVRKLSGRPLRCAVWVELDTVAPQTLTGWSSILVGTKNGEVLLLRMPRRGHREEGLVSLWSAPDGTEICGLRIEHAGGTLVGLLGTAFSLFHFSGGSSLEDLFSDPIRNAKAIEVGAQEIESNVVPQLEFMSGNRQGNLASRKFVWLTAAGALQGELELSRSRDQLRQVRTSIANRVLIRFVDGSIPKSVNLTSFHILVLHEGSLEVYSQISGRLVQSLDLTEQILLAPSSRRTFSLISISSETLTHAHDFTGNKLVRDRALDCVWIVFREGHLVRVHMEDEKREVWLDAKKMGRFDIALELAPPEGRHLVLEAQADRFVEEEDYECAVRLYARTARPVESVYIMVVRRFEKDRSRRNMLLIDYLSRKLDTIDGTEPSQRTILASLVVEHYASEMGASTTGKALVLGKAFEAFLEDHWADLDLDSALSVLQSHALWKYALHLCKLRQDCRRATDIAILHADVSHALDAILNFDEELETKEGLRQRAEILSANTARMLNIDAQQVTRRWLLIRGKLLSSLSYDTLISGLLEILRSGRNREVVFSLLKETLESLVFSGPEIQVDGARSHWTCLLFQLHAESNDLDGMRTLIDRIQSNNSGIELRSLAHRDLSVILGSLVKARCVRLAIPVVSALGLHGKALRLAAAVDIQLAELHAKQLNGWNLSSFEIRKLWLQVARMQPDDIVGVVNRSDGTLQVEDVFSFLPDFCRLDGPLKRVVLDSLLAHRRATKRATEAAARFVEQGELIQLDIDEARQVRLERRSPVAQTTSAKPQASHRTGYLSQSFLCGHRWDRPSSSVNFDVCPYCDATGMIHLVDEPLFEPNAGVITTGLDRSPANPHSSKNQEGILRENSE